MSRKRDLELNDRRRHRQAASRRLSRHERKRRARALLTVLVGIVAAVAVAIALHAAMTSRRSVGGGRTPAYASTTTVS